MSKSIVKRGALGTLAGALALGVWGMVFWGWLAHLSLGCFRRFPTVAEVTESCQAIDLQTGTYFVPWPRDTPEAFEEFVEHHKRGSFYKLSYIREGVDPQSPGKLLLGSLHNASVALIAVLLSLAVGPSRYAKQAGIVFLAGMMGTNFISVADPIWFHLPWDYTGGVLLYEIVSWALLAGVTAGIVRINLVRA